jgi:phage-related protein
MKDLNERLRRFEQSNRELDNKEIEEIKKNIKNIDIDKTDNEGNVSNIP